MRSCVFLLAAVAFGGCDPSARGSSNGEPAAPPRTSAAYESCAGAAGCAEGARCVDGVCTLARSRLGDFHVAVGAHALAQGAINDSVQSYNAAVTQYEQEGLEVPADVFCAQGRALTEARMDPQKAEAAARVLHRCLLGVPGGSALYRRALADLAVLGEVGLEPTLLTRDEPADLYLTRAPSKPPLDALALSVSGDAKRAPSTYKTLLEALGSDDAKAKLAPCWESYWKATREDAFQVTLPFSYRLRLHEDDPSLDKAFLELGNVDEPGDPAQAAAQNCARGVAEEIAAEVAKGLKADQRWKANVTISLGQSG